MSTLDIPIESMPLSERLGLLSRLRESLPPNSVDNVSMPEWHGDVIGDRVKEADEGRGEWVDLVEVRERLARRYQ